jgi:hypothetical protein
MKDRNVRKLRNTTLDPDDSHVSEVSDLGVSVAEDGSGCDPSGGITELLSSLSLLARMYGSLSVYKL